MNLLTNASKFQMVGRILVCYKFIQLSSSENKYKLEVKVIDRGIGVCPEDVDSLFKPFFKS